MRILFIHGIDQQGRSEAELRSVWGDALSKGMKAAGTVPRKFTISLPYFGDDLLRLSEEFGKKSESLEEDVFISRALAEMGEPADDQLQTNMHPEMELYPRIDGDLDKRGGETGSALPEPLRDVIRMADDFCPVLTNWYLRRYLRVVYAYINFKNVSGPIDDMVLAKVDESANEPTLLVGHSLGSVIAYNALNARPKVPWRGFVTLGSPLGIKAIKDGLPKYDPRIPSFKKNHWEKHSSAHWINAFDPRDIVALNPLKEPFWEPSKAIHNQSHINNHTSNKHGIAGYLSDARVAEAINAALSPES